VTSARKIIANRTNARASSGPKTKHGRARSARNALRHALSLPVAVDPSLSREVDALAHEIAGANASPQVLELARRIAEAQADLYRVRSARHQFLSENLKEPYFDSAASMRAKVAFLHEIFRSKHPDISLTEIAEFVRKVPEGPQKLAMILSEKATQLHRFDRYERRATSRRKFAIRNFDEARRLVGLSSKV
jgi:hypothetical protein